MLKDKVVLITGASGGIGSVIAKSLAKLCKVVVLFGGRNIEKLNQVKDQIEKDGGEAYLCPFDLSNIKNIPNNLESVVNKYSKIDILINCAGLAQSTAFSEVSEREFDDIFNLDVKVPYFLTQYALPYLKKSDYATIINISSVVGHLGYPLQSTYSAAKHALMGFTKSLASEVYKDGIRVHAISPGGVFTDMVKISRPDLSEEGMILPSDVADTVVFLLTHRTSAVIDEIIIHRVNKPPFLV